jgi:hypothetical protein
LNYPDEVSNFMDLPHVREKKRKYFLRMIHRFLERLRVPEPEIKRIMDDIQNWTKL